MSYARLQMLTRAKEEQRRHWGEVGGVVDVDAEEGEGEGDDASSMRAPEAGGPRGRWAGPARPPNCPPSSGASPRLHSPRRQRTWTHGWWRRRGPCLSGKSGRLRRRGRFSSCGASFRRRSSGRTRTSGGQLQQSGSGTCCGPGPANPSRHSPCLQAPHARQGPGRWEVHWHCKPVVSPCERPSLALVHYTGA